MIKLAKHIEIAGECNVKIKIINPEHKCLLANCMKECVEIAELPTDKNILIKDESGVWFMVSVEE